MQNEKLNITLIKRMLFEEIKQFSEWKEKKNKLSKLIEELHIVLDFINHENYIEIYKNYEKYERTFKEYLNFTQKDCSEFYIYLYFLNNFNKNNISELEKQKIEYATNVLKKYYNKIIEELKPKEEELQNIKSPIDEKLIDDYKKLLFDFSYKQIIGPDGYKIIMAFLDKKGFSEKEKVILLEKVKINNIFIELNKKGEKVNMEQINKVLDVINFGYEYLQKPHYPNINNNKINIIVESCKTLFAGYNFDNAKAILPEFDGIDSFTYGYSKEEFEYIMIDLLMYYQKQLMYCYSNIIKMDNYIDKDYRYLYVKEYYDNLNMYRRIRKYMDEELEKYNSMYQPGEQEKTEISGKKIYYSLRNTDGVNTFFENDLKDIPYDLYSGIISLIERFEKNNLPAPKLRALNEVFPGLKEIKNDQVRIMYRHIKGNEYVITGVFLKKRDLSRVDLDRIYARPIDKIVSAEEINHELFNMMNDKKHSGGRKNS